MPPVDEEGATCRENAEHKALVWSERAGMVAVATDGGLVIPALGGRWEAVRTGRSAGRNATDRDRLDSLLDLMRPFSGRQRAAFWTEALALAEGGRILGSWETESPKGLLAEAYDPDRISPGFWAFSLWYLPEMGKVHVDLTPEELDTVDDHWGRLRESVRAFLEVWR